jgi:cell wall-associated NlpC family hydrolase
MPDKRHPPGFTSPSSGAIIWLGLSLLFFLILCIGCSSVPGKPIKASSQSSVEFKLRQAAKQWHRTPHRLGGLDRRGVDCSGLVKVLYDDLFHIHLPRTSKWQARCGSAIESGQWAAGDLLFFRPADKGSHVGIYIADREFLHATIKRGVTISRLSEPYWQQSYWKARRILKHDSN